MRFVETSIFTRRLTELMPDSEYRHLQIALVFRPQAGALIPGGGGLRKIRWRLRGSGKRGGIRIIYYWAGAEQTIYLLLVYRKNEQETLTPAQLRLLRKLVKEHLR